MEEINDNNQQIQYQEQQATFHQQNQNNETFGIQQNDQKGQSNTIKIIHQTDIQQSTNQQQTVFHNYSQKVDIKQLLTNEEQLNIQQVEQSETKIQDIHKKFIHDQKPHNANRVSFDEQQVSSENLGKSNAYITSNQQIDGNNMLLQKAAQVQEKERWQTIDHNEIYVIKQESLRKSFETILRKLQKEKHQLVKRQCPFALQEEENALKNDMLEMKRGFSKVKDLFSLYSCSKKIMEKKNRSIKDRINAVSEELRISNLKNLKDGEISKFYMVEMARFREFGRQQNINQNAANSTMPTTRSRAAYEAQQQNTMGIPQKQAFPIQQISQQQQLVAPQYQQQQQQQQQKPQLIQQQQQTQLQ